MALPMLMGGADCGPSNPLQNLSKRFDQDRGIQQDHFSSARAGSSRETFRTQGHARGPDQDAARFFSSNQGAAPQISAPAPYDLSALHRSLPAAHAQSPIQRQPNSALAAWASDFLQQQPRQSPGPQVVSPKADVHQERERSMDIQMTSPTGMVQSPMNWNAYSIGYGASHLQNFDPQVPMQHQQTRIQPDQAIWDKEFESISNPIEPLETLASIERGPENQTQPLQEVQSKAQPPQDGDELARTAGLLIESVRDEQNPKFQNSQFMGLMKALRDREVVVEGDKMVGTTGAGAGWASEFQNQTDIKGKGRAIDRPVDGESVSGQTAEQLDSRRAYRSMTRNFSQSNIGDQSIQDRLSEMLSRGANHVALGQRLEEAQIVQDSTVHPDVADMMELENAEYADYWDAHHTKPAQHAVPETSQSADWDRMQRQWEQFEANATGFRPVDSYQFQTNNPYLLGDRSRNRQHLMHLHGPQSFYESVLELEAAIQRDPTDASAWYELGVKQQENEREQKAIQALRRAVELDPAHLPTWIALAVSYTNDSNRTGTYNAIGAWVEGNDKYSQAVMQYRAEFPENPSASATEKFSHLIQCLINMARSDASGEIDADIQIALAVLLNTNEDYEKAQDCFRTALAVRPEDWLLYNRVGATMANSGRAEEALQFYYRALELNPAYIRARFNLGISCINLRRYDEAAQHILDALVLQDSDGVHDSSGLNDNRGVTSSALWDSLKTTCLHMQRIDLAMLCDRQDLDGFRNDFHTELSI